MMAAPHTRLHRARGFGPARWWIGLQLLGLVALAGGCSDKGEPDGSAALQPPARVILISIDTLRSDRLGCYGYERNTSPQLDALAAEAVLFETVCAQAAQTLISHKSLLAGKYPLRLVREATNADLEMLTSRADARRFVVNTFADLRSAPLVTELPQQGYRCAAFTDGRWMSRVMRFDQGFDDFNDDGGHLVAILPRVYDWLGRQRQDGRFFLFVHTYDTHCPYTCREPYNSMFCPDCSQHISLEGRCGKPDLMNMTLSARDLRAISDHYDGGIASADAYLGEFFDRLRDLGIYDDALLIVTSDHGESLGTHEQIGHGGLYLEQLLVPLIVKLPASWGIAARRIEQPVALLDIMPTLCEACGVAAPPEIDGRSLLPLIRGGEWRREHLIAQITYNEGRAAVTNPVKRAILEPGRWLLIHDAKTPAAELFDLQADPTGLTAAAGDRKKVLQRLAADLAAYDPGQPRGEFTRPEEADIDEEFREQLRELGYVEP